MTNKYTEQGPDVNPLLLVCTEELSRELTSFYDKAEDISEFMVNRKDSNPTMFAGNDGQSNDEINDWKNIGSDAADLATQLTRKEFSESPDTITPTAAG